MPLENDEFPIARFKKDIWYVHKHMIIAEADFATIFYYGLQLVDLLPNVSFTKLQPCQKKEKRVYLAFPRPKFQQNDHIHHTILIISL